MNIVLKELDWCCKRRSMAQDTGLNADLSWLRVSWRLVGSQSPCLGTAFLGSGNQKRLLFGLVFLVCNNLFRTTKLVFHLLAIVNLSNSLEHDLVARIEPLLDHKDVIQFVLDDDLALMHHAIFVDDINVLLVENLESRPLRDDEWRLCSDRWINTLPV